MSTVLLLDAFTVVVTACKNYRKKKPMETWDVQRHALGVHATCRVPRVTDPLFAEEGRPSEGVRPFVHAAVVVVADEDDDNHRCSVGRRDI